MIHPGGDGRRAAIRITDRVEGESDLLGPIFNREWLTIPRRPLHYLTRAAYLGLLWVLSVTAWQATVGWNATATLGATARFGELMFQIICVVQLVLLLFFSALSAASAIAQEKDRRTFVLLLLTDLRDWEIVLGKVLGSLLQMGILLSVTAPLLVMMLLLGGIAPFQVVQALLVLGAAAWIAGSLGGLIALWRERTFQSLALTVLTLVLALCLARALAWVPVEMVRRWHVWLDPFAALAAVLDARPDAPGLSPAYGYAVVMVVLGALLNGWAILRLRVWNPSGEPIMQREAPADADVEEQDRAVAHAAPGPVRQVWSNPILWREIVTGAYGRRSVLVKVAYFVVLMLICSYAFAALPGNLPGARRLPFVAAYGLAPVSILSLLLVSAQAVTAITSERDIGSLDLLLVTDLTPREFIFGKLGGILYNTKEFLLPPLLLAVFYAWSGLLATPPRGYAEQLASRNVVSLAAIIGGLLVLIAFVMILGLHVALRTLNSRLAITTTLGTVFFLSTGTLICIYLILVSGRFEQQWASFILFIAAAIGGLWWVLSGDQPSAALTLASWLCPIAVFYTVINVLIARPGSEESTDPLMPLLVIAGTFGFTISAMLIPLLSEFDIALGRTSREGE